MKKHPILAVLLLLLLSACTQTDITPKPRAYPRVIYPEKAYQPFTEGYCNFSFEYPKYAKVQQDTLFFEEQPANPCWFNLYYPDFDATVHFSYYPIASRQGFDKLVRDAHELVNKHNIKANYIDEIALDPSAGVSGIAFDIRGAAASPFQFYLTDSTRNFIRGALYFNTQARPDSLAPVLDFVKEDLAHAIETFRWNK